jgi:PIN domain nuclease of toxin-antitoxin system
MEAGSLKRRTEIRYLLDTHALIWAAVEDERLGKKAAKAIHGTAFNKLAISDVSLQEIGMLLHLGRLKIVGRPEEIFSTLLDHVTIVPISLEIALAAPGLRLPHGDQFDRIICATALSLGVPLITRDGNLTDSGIVSVLW